MKTPTKIAKLKTYVIYDPKDGKVRGTIVTFTGDEPDASHFLVFDGKVSTTGKRVDVLTKQLVDKKPRKENRN